MAKLEDKVAVITGASSGIGAGIAETFAREGAHVIVNYNRSGNLAEQVVAQIDRYGKKVIAIQADISDPNSVNDLVEQVRSEFGGIDIWVNNAGADILTSADSKLNHREKLNRLIEVDLKGTINCCWAAVAVMSTAGHGAIVNVTWDLAMHGFQGRNSQIFAAAKAGIHGFSLSLSKTYAPDIRVNLVAPGWIETAFATDVMDNTYFQERVAEIPMKRFGTPEDVANAVLYLVSDEASYITGQVLLVNGGLI